MNCATRKNIVHRNEMIEFAISVIAIIGLIVAVVWSVAHAANTPEVVFSWSTKQCIEVNYMDGTKGDCSNLPSKYDHVWGE